MNNLKYQLEEPRFKPYTNAKDDCHLCKSNFRL